MHTRAELERPEGLSSAVIAAVADHQGVDPVALDPPLYDAIDPDALDSLFPGDPNGQSPQRARLSFSYDGLKVAVSSDGTVQVQERQET